MNRNPLARLAATLTLILLAACTAPTITPDHGDHIPTKPQRGLPGGCEPC